MMKVYTPEEAAFIAAHWRTMTDAQLGVALGRSPSSIGGFRNHRGWRRGPPMPPAGAAFERPRGFTAEALTWATDHPTDREARMIHAFQRDKAARAYVHPKGADHV